MNGLLGGQLPPSPSALSYRLSFFSGGIGVIDNLSVTLNADRALFDRVVKALKLISWSEAQADEEVRWWLDVEDHPGPDQALAAFLAEHGITAAQETWFDSISGVNSWSVVAWTGEVLHLRAYNQG
ncbi:MAG: hypothetical protein QM723_30115 [Myxococcaceae bacterium]